jgi:hypothetical protein
MIKIGCDKCRERYWPTEDHQCRMDKSPTRETPPARSAALSTSKKSAITSLVPESSEKKIETNSAPAAHAIWSGRGRPFDRTAYQREYMRLRRAKQKDEKSSE